jgi:hypothetical protein
MVLRCPVCSTKAIQVWKSSGGTNGSSWFTGQFLCTHCGHFKASGTERNGELWLVAWNPGCPDHGTDPVYQTDMEGREFVCSVCHRKMQQVETKLVTTWQPYQPNWIDHAMSDPYFGNMGGLPHD